MMLKTKEIKLITILHQTKDTLSSAKLAEWCGISDRTVRTYIQRINQELSSFGARIEAIKGLGYYLQVDNKLLFQSFLNQYSNQYDIRHILLDPAGRRDFLLRKLLFESKVEIDSYLDQMYISESTLMLDVKQLKKELAQASLQIKLSKNTLRLVGNELSVGHYIFHHFLSPSGFLKTTLRADLDDLLNGISLEETSMVIIKFIRQWNLQVDDLTIHHLALQLAIGINQAKLVQEQKKFNPIDWNSKMMEPKMKTLFDLVVEKFKVNLSHDTLKLLGQLLHKETSHEESMSPLQEKMMKTEIELFLARLAEVTSKPLHQDQQLIDGLYAHIKQLRGRIAKVDNQINPLVQEIKTHYGDIFDLVSTNIHRIDCLSGVKLSENELGFITMHLIAAIERATFAVKAQTLLVCTTGKGSAQLLKSRLEKEFGTKLTLGETIGIYQLDQIDFSNYDLVITTVDLSHFILPIPVVQSSIFVSDQDRHLISQQLGKLNYHEGTASKADQYVDYDYLDKAVIRRIFHQCYYKNYQKRVTREEVLGDFTDLIDSIEPGTKKALLHQYDYRETFGSVIFSPQVAVPHPVDPVTEGSYLGIIIGNDGIDWENQEVHLSFVLGPSKCRDKEFEQLSLFLVQLIEEKPVIEKIMKAKDRYDLLEAIDHYLT